MANLISFDVPVDGDIVEVAIIGDGGSGTATFSLDLNGVALYAGAARPSLSSGDTSDVKTGLTDAVVFEDRLSLSLVEITGGGLAPRLTLIVKIDDGLSPIGDLDDLGDVDTTGVADGDSLVYDSGTSSWIPGAGGGGGGVPSPALIFNEPFTGGTIDSAIWNTPGAGTSQGSGKLTINASASEQLTSLSSILITPASKDASWHNKQVTIKIPTVPGPSAQLAAQFFVSYSGTIGTYYHLWQVYNGNITATSLNHPSLSKTITYNAGNHIYFRIRNINGLTTFWHSPDGVDWTFHLATEPAVGGLIDAYNPFYLILRLYNISGGAATVEFDDLTLEDLSVWFPN